MKDLVDAVVEFTGVAESDVLKLSRIAPQTYRKYLIPKKRRGQMRQIHHPSKQTKMLQYAVMDLVLQHVNINKAAHGFVQGVKSPLRKHAEYHAKNPYLLRLDFKDFFPSIYPDDLLRYLDVGSTINKITLSYRDHEFLIGALFVRNPNSELSLAIGAPTSPIVSNIVMKDLDEKLSTLATECDFLYTRYADDLTFSTPTKGRSSNLLSQVVEVLEEHESPKVQLNTEKTCYMSKNCRRAITGLIITPDGSISIGRKNKRMLKSLLHDAAQWRITPENAAYLQGYLAFLLDVEPKYFNSLSLKYGADVVERALKRGHVY